MTPVQFFGSEGNVLRGDVRSGPAANAAVLFMHGGGQTRHSWEAAAKTVMTEHTAYTLDARGHGESEWPSSGDYRFSAMAADTACIVDEIAAKHGRRPVLVGASMGGLAAMLASADRSNLLGGLVLVDITPRMEQSGVDRILGFMSERSASGFTSPDEAADAIAAYLPGRAKPPTSGGLDKNLRRGSDGRYRWHWDPRFVSGPLSVENEAGEHEERLENALRSADYPILLVRGSRSELVSEEAVLRFRTAVPAADYVDVSGAGHMVVGDRNDAFCDAVLRFLRARCR